MKMTNRSVAVSIAGLPVLCAGAIANAGSSQAISNVETATAASVARGFGSPDTQIYKEAPEMAERRTLLERVKLANGC